MARKARRHNRPRKYKTPKDLECLKCGKLIAIPIGGRVKGQGKKLQCEHCGESYRFKKGKLGKLETLAEYTRRLQTPPNSPPVYNPS